MDFDNLGFDSYMVPLGDDGEFIGFRNLEVDNRLLLPYGARTRVLVTAADVIHSWAIPSLGIKLDGTPGRLGQTYVGPRRPGVVYGQCSEICGAYHSFMPISVEFIRGHKFVKWLKLVG
jgi:cytochrome c oxidase subunit 2